MSFLNVLPLLKRIGTAALVLPKPHINTVHLANCTTTSSSSDHHNHTEDCDEAPIRDMENPFQKDRQSCILCKMNITPNYKNVKLLSQFVSIYTGKIYGRHITGLCTKRQQQVEGEIVKAQNAGLMPYYLKDPAFMQDPELFNPDTPFRNHPY